VGVSALLLAPSSFAHGRHPSATKIGAGVQAAPLVLASSVHRGRTYRFAPLYVVNTGTQTSDYTVRVYRLRGGSGRDVPSSWLRLGRTKLRLRARQSTLVPVRLVVPRDAVSGYYRTDLVVGTSTAPPGRGAALGAAAADALRFTIAAPGGFSWGSPWLRDTLIGLVSLVLLVVIARRLGLHVEIERRK
jgi:hypothetical protein